MSTQSEWDRRYAANDLPWDTGRPDRNLQELTFSSGITPCKALELGCGTGTNAIWLARQGFDVTAVEISESALLQARAKQDADQCTFVQADFLTMPTPEQRYGFVFDLGCFHYFHEEAERVLFAQRVSESLQAEGLWLSVIGSTDGQQMGPPGRSALEVIRAVEPCFEIISLEASELETADDAALKEMGLPTNVEHRAWCCLMQKRPNDAGAPF